jgi:CheY-like chemotaxis protein
VLLVEDDARLILLSEKILARLGYTVLLARNGGEAIETIESHGEDIAIVVTDVVMPILGGRPLVERIRSLRPDLPVLFMSGYTNDEVTRRGILEGEVPFIQKPFTPDDFGRKIREVLDSVMTA